MRTRRGTEYPKGLATPPRHHRWATMCAKWAGRRDGRRRLEADQQGHRPYTRLLAARVHRGQSALDAWLHEVVEPVDRTSARLATDLVRIERRTPKLEAEITAALSEADSATGVVQVKALRRLRRLQAEQTELAARTERDSGELAELLSRRRHLLETARGAAAAFEAHYRILGSIYQDAYHRRNRASEVSPPELTNFLPWVGGDLALLVAVIDPTAARLLGISRDEFWDDRAAS